MKITIACKYFSPRGGAQTFLINFVRCLLDDGHRIKVLTTEAMWQMAGLETRILALPRVPKSFRDLAFAGAVRNALEQEACDVSFSEQRAWGADVVRLGGGVQREYLREIIKSYPTFPMRAWKRLTMRLSLKELLSLHIERVLCLKHPPRLLIANSDMVRRQLLKHYPSLEGRVAVVYNGADCYRLGPQLKRHRKEVRRDLGIPQEALVGGFVSYDFRRKGLPTVLRSMAVLKRKPARMGVYLIVVGKRKAWAERMARRLGVGERVRFVGPQKPDKYYGASDLLLLPSYYDPCANVTLEGLACGLPAITSIYNGAYELLTPGLDGFYLQDASDAAQLAGFIEYFMEPEKLLLGSKAARALALKHTLQHQHTQLMDLIMPVAEQKAKELRLT